MKRIPTGPLSEDAYAALARYAEVYGLKLAEAVVDLIVQGLRIPRLVGAPRPIFDEVDSLLGGLIPNSGAAVLREEREHLAREAHEVRGTEGDLAWETPTKARGAAAVEASDESLPLLGYNDVNEVLAAQAHEKRAGTREKARAGGLDAFFDSIEGLATNHENTEDAQRVEPAGSGDTVAEPPAPAPSPVASPDVADDEPYRTRQTMEQPAARVVTNPMTGAQEHIIPDAFLPGSALSADAALHAAMAQREETGYNVPEPEGDTLRAVDLHTALQLATGVGLPNQQAHIFERLGIKD